MELTALQVYEAAPVVARIINEKRPLPQKGSYRMARLYNALKPEYDTINQRRDALISAYDYRAPTWDGPEGSEPPLSVPPDKIGEFLAAWKEIAEEKIEVPVQPVPLEQLILADVPGSIEAAEFIALGPLVADAD